MITGGVHSGPVSSIRYVGAVGMVMFMILLVLMAREAVRLVRLARGTDYFILALFVAVPIVWEPINFVFIFGGYESGLPNAIISIGLLKVLANTLGDLPGAEIARIRPASQSLLPHPDRPQLQPAGAFSGSTARAFHAS